MRAYAITVSDKGYAGEREDVSGKVICDVLSANGYEIAGRTIVPDEMEMIESAIVNAAKQADFVVTSGGTGFAKRDVTPEATLAVIERQAQGVAEAIRANGMKFTDRAMLSRGVCGIVGDTLVLNLPGSPKAVEEDLTFVLGAIGHGLGVLKGEDKECARKD